MSQTLEETKCLHYNETPVEDGDSYRHPHVSCLNRGGGVSAESRDRLEPDAQGLLAVALAGVASRDQ